MKNEQESLIKYVIIFWHWSLKASHNKWEPLWIHFSKLLMLSEFIDKLGYGILVKIYT